VAERVALFIDYQNMHFTALGEFCPYGTPPEDALVHPLLIAERIVQKRSTKRASALEYVKVYRGRPNPAHHPSMTSANDAQKAAWERDARVTVIRRDLNYRGWPQQPPREKGIDVKLAVDLVQSSMLAEYDVAVVFSGDTDLLPALEMAFPLHRADDRDRVLDGRETSMVPRPTTRQAIPAVLSLPQRRRLPSLP